MVAEIMIQSRREFVSFAPMVHTPEEVALWVGEVLVPGGGVYVAEQGGALVGMLAISSGKDSGWIDQLYLMPGWTGRGIGSLLLEVAHRCLAPPVRLYTFQANTGACRFYERHGYRVIATSDGSGTEERCPDVLYEWRGNQTAARPSPR